MSRAALALAVVLAACGGRATPPAADPGSGAGSATAAADPRPEIERRRDAACEQLASKLFDCAAEDVRKDYEAGKTSKQELDSLTSPDMRRAHRKAWLDKCEVAMTSYQVRVLEVCYREEPTCGPLLDCLDHLNDRK